ncbi:MAG: four helix bundle protein [Candidatus Methylomirabilales bacterium]
MYKFERLEVYQLALEYLDLVYLLVARLPRIEDPNLKPQLLKAGTSVVLNIAEGSTGLSDAEQARFISIALRSLLETVACRQIVQRRKYLSEDDELLKKMETLAKDLARKLQNMRNVLEGR